MLVVIDTNILVSSLWSKKGAPAQIISMILNGTLVPCYDYRIINEYRQVLSRKKFGFPASEVNSLLEWFEAYGMSVIPNTIDEPFVDEDDKKFYEVAKFCKAPLITGNTKHFPIDPLVVTVSEFLENVQRQ